MDIKNHLHNKHCTPCIDGGEPFTPEEVHVYLLDLQGWQSDSDSKKISKEFKFKNFIEAIRFVEKVADIAEAEGHHPDIGIHYNKVTLTNYTHKIGGLSENDFILAFKIDKII